MMAVMKYYISVHCTLVTDSVYNSLSLAHCPVENKTHLVESFRQNQRALGETVGKGSNARTVVAKRNVTFTAMRHGLTMIDTEKETEKQSKPPVILFYNYHIKGIDISVKMDS